MSLTVFSFHGPPQCSSKFRSALGDNTADTMRHILAYHTVGRGQPVSVPVVVLVVVLALSSQRPKRIRTARFVGDDY